MLDCAARGEVLGITSAARRGEGGGVLGRAAAGTEAAAGMRAAGWVDEFDWMSKALSL